VGLLDRFGKIGVVALVIEERADGNAKESRGLGSGQTETEKFAELSLFFGCEYARAADGFGEMG
jgi:hypothetical protein